jgi:hypothetical protein
VSKVVSVARCGLRVVLACGSCFLVFRQTH